jgi:Flp pilus assembly protein TadG
MPRSSRSQGPRNQRGAIAIIVGLTLAVMMGFAGLALDGGRLYVNKTETQNAADACALAAAKELTGAPNIPLGNFPIAEDAGRTVATLNRANFQQAAIANANVTVDFSSALSGAAWVGAGSAAANSQYVRCTIAQPNISPWFMQVLGFGNQTVSSFATATLAPSQTTCVAPLPVSMCATGSSPPYGLVVGQWYSALFGTGGQLTGNFGWVDFTPPAGGASELANLLATSSSCTTTIPPGTLVGQPGAAQSLSRDWNTRFGIYHPSSAVPTVGSTLHIPDRSGYSYTPTNWPSQANAWPNFRDVRVPANAPYGVSVNAGNTLTGLSVSPSSSTVLQATQLATIGRSNRRVAPAPIVNCAGYGGGSSTTPIIDWGCVLMLHPISQTGGPEIVRLEYLGLVSAAGSPCATQGGVGGPGSTGPLVPGLVQ